MNRKFYYCLCCVLMSAVYVFSEGKLASCSNRLKAIKAYNDKNFSQAMSLIALAITENKLNALNYYWRAKIRIDKKGKKKDICRALELNPDCYEALVFYGDLLLNSHQEKTALQYYNRALKIRPSSPAFLGKAFVFYCQKQWEKSLSYFSLALDLHPQNMIALEYRALSLIHLQKTKEAIEDCRKVLLYDSNNKRMWDALARLFFIEKQYEYALICWEQSKTKYDYNVKIIHNIGLCLIQLQLYDRAQQIFQDIVILDPQNVYAYNQLGNIFIKKCMFDRAIESYSKAIHIDPTECGLYYNRARSYEKKGFFEKAIQDYKEVLNHKNVFVRAHFFLAQIYYKQKKWQKSIKELNLFLESENSTEDILITYRIMAHSYMFLQDYKKAIAVWSFVLSMYPKSEECYFQRALCYTQMGCIKEASVDYQMVLALNKKSAATYYNLGNLFYRQNRFRQAIKLFDAALAINPLWRDAYYNRAAAKKAIGDTLGTYGDFKKSLF